ncbi:hypothetical protein AQJ64_24260 [Streptomyces griseoruber]|uniref:Uncharacterized protein n=1 Tax=Streptomyces griseoruber TaxID=1943 RepID=A0A117RAW5_9ACTN|nr:hypothetical protein AQJ64_24260 [Streptomyces griseoruber]
MGGGAPSVQQAGCGQDERAGAQGGHPGARVVGRAHRVDQFGGRFHVDVGPAGDYHGVGAPEVVEAVVGLEVEPAEGHDARPADREVVPGNGDRGRCGAENLVGHGQFEVEHPVGDGQRDSSHV